MRVVPVYVENNAGMAFYGWSAAWVFEPELWGRCGQGPDQAAALADLARQLPSGIEPRVVESHVARSDEEAFVRDHEPCTEAERTATLTVLAETRPATIALLASLPDAVLDWDDPERVLPSYARWRTIRQLAWHVCDTESRYYLPLLGLGYRERASDLRTELVESASHVRAVVAEMPVDLVRVHAEHGTWTTVKVLRRLAWHERGELAVLRALATKAAEG